MLPKDHLTLNSRMPGSRWVITPSSVYSCHLFLISSAFVGPYHFCSLLCLLLQWNVPLPSPVFWKRSLVIPILLFSSISLHCSFKKAFLSLLAISGILHWIRYIFPFLLAFHFSSFLSFCKASLEVFAIPFSSGPDVHRTTRQQQPEEALVAWEAASERSHRRWRWEQGSDQHHQFLAQSRRTGEAGAGARWWWGIGSRVICSSAEAERGHLLLGGGSAPWWPGAAHIQLTWITNLYYIYHISLWTHFWQNI